MVHYHSNDVNLLEKSSCNQSIELYVAIHSFIHSGSIYGFLSMCQSGESDWAQALLSVNSQSSKRDRKQESLIVLHGEKVK